MGYYEETLLLYDKWLRSKGFRIPVGRTNHKELAAAIADYYGKEYLSGLDAYNSGACIWARGILHYPNKLAHPMYHILLIRFLAGSAEAFFHSSCDVPGERQPFGAPPYPCRNVICDYNLHDVIEHIDITMTRGHVSAKFICPLCGFAYQRGRPLQKEKQYSDRPFVIDYGQKWHEMLVELLNTGTSVSNVASILHCGIQTVRKFGVKTGILHEGCIVRRKVYPKKKVAASEPLSFDEQMEAYRQRWRKLLSARPAAYRSELMFLDEKCHMWLKANDASWYELNTPATRVNTPKWADSDAEFATSLRMAADEMLNAPGKPVWINVTSLAKKAGIIGLHTKLATGRLPKSQSVLDDIVETSEQWRRRRVTWAMHTLQTQGVAPTYHSVCNMAGLSGRVAVSLKDFIFEQISALYDQITN